jgi:ABC-type spermidine/putrescine transport system permease subunit II
MSWRLYSKIFRIAILTIAVIALIYLVLPTFVIVPLSFSSTTYLSFPPPDWSGKWYVKLWATDAYFKAFFNTLKVGIPAALIAVTLGTLAALAIVRGRLRAARPISALIIAPLMLPQIILAIGLFPVLATFGLIGSYLGVILGHAVVCTPLVFITVSAALRGYDSSFELAAMTLGANWWRTFWNVTFPMIRLGMIVGGIFAFAFSFDEIIIALFLTDAETFTLPKQLYDELRYQMEPTIAAASSFVLTISFLLLGSVAVIQRLGARRQQALTMARK